MIHNIFGHGEGVQHIIVVAHSEVVLVGVVLIVHFHVVVVVIVLDVVTRLHVLEHVVSVGAFAAIIEYEHKGVCVLVAIQAIEQELIDSGQEPAIGNHLQRMGMCKAIHLTLNHFPTYVDETLLDVIDVVHVLALEVEILQHSGDLLLVLLVQVMVVENVGHDIVEVRCEILHQHLIVQQSDPLESTGIVVESYDCGNLVAPVILSSVNVLGQEVILAGALLNHGSEGDHGIVVPIVHRLGEMHNLVRVLVLEALLHLVKVIDVVMLVPVAAHRVQHLHGVLNGHLFILQRPLVVLSSALHDSLMEETLGHRGHHVEADTSRASTIAEHGHLIAIATEEVNVFLNPFHHHNLILESVVAVEVIVVHGEETESSQSVVTGDENHIIFQKVLGPSKLDVSIAHGVTTSVQIEHHRQILPLVLLVLHLLHKCSE